MPYRFADSLRTGSASKLSENLYILLCVQCKTSDDGQRNCPKHVEFYSKNKFEELVHLVDFIIRIFHDARSAERQILFRVWKNQRLLIFAVNFHCHKTVSL